MQKAEVLTRYKLIYTENKKEASIINIYCNQSLCSNMIWIYFAIKLYSQTLTFRKAVRQQTWEEVGDLV